ncbi:MAG: hypothetical protein IPH54_06955 [Rhodoferax sp.]|nr:hypothetical protein [Rhodoferax sp.]
MKSLLKRMVRPWPKKNDILDGLTPETQQQAAEIKPRKEGSREFVQLRD